MRASACLPIQEVTQVGEARRQISALAQEIGLSETLRGQISIIVTELGNNIVKHARSGGALVYRALGDRPGIEVLAIDQGAGMTDVDRCMTDGYSTAGSPGTGLGAVSRLSTVFDIYSVPERGTAVLSQIWAPRPGGVRPTFDHGAVCIPVRGETLCGDAWQIDASAQGASLIAVDGLGHGPLAEKAADAALEMFSKNPKHSPLQAVQAVHMGLRSTRGAAVAVAVIDRDHDRVRYSGLGNTVGVIFSRTSGHQRRMVSLSGTAGVQATKVQEFTYPWDATSVLVLHSDGLSTHWNLDKYPGLFSRHPSVVAGVLYRDFNRGTDDAMVVVAREAAR